MLAASVAMVVSSCPSGRLPSLSAAVVACLGLLPTSMPLFAQNSCAADNDACVVSCGVQNALPSVVGLGGGLQGAYNYLSCTERCAANFDSCTQQAESPQGDHAEQLFGDFFERETEASGQDAVNAGIAGLASPAAATVPPVEVDRAQQARQLLMQFPSRAVVPTDLLLVAPTPPGLQLVRDISGNDPMLNGNALLYGDSSSVRWASLVSQEEGFLARGELIGGVGLPDGTGRLVITLEDEITDTGQYVVQRVDPKGQVQWQLSTGLRGSAEDPGEPTLHTRELHWGGDDKVLFLWIANHVPVGKFRDDQPLDTLPLEVLAVDVANGEVLRRQSFPEADGLRVTPVADTSGAERVWVFTASRSSAQLTATDWQSGRVVYTVPINTPNISRARGRRATQRNNVEILDDGKWGVIDGVTVNVWTYLRGEYELGSAGFRAGDGSDWSASAAASTGTEPTIAAEPLVPTMTVEKEDAGYAVLDTEGRRLADGYDYGEVLAQDLVWVRQKETNDLWLIDNSGARTLLKKDGWWFVRLGDWIVHMNGTGRKTRDFDSIWKLRQPPPLDPEVEALRNGLSKDEYETTAEYQARLAATSAPFSRVVTIEGYEADAARMRLSLEGYPLSVGIAPAEARLFRGKTSAALAGRMRILSPDVLEIVSATLGDSEISPVPLTAVLLDPPPAATPPPAGVAVAPTLNVPESLPGLAPAPEDSLPTAGLAGVAIPQGMIAAAAGAQCQRDLGFLAALLPAYGLLEIDEARSAVLLTDLDTTMGAALAQGYSAESAIEASLQQAIAYDESAEDALQTASQADGSASSVGDFRQSLDTLVLPNCETLRNSSLCAAITFRMGAVASRATADQMRCHVRAGTFPR